MKPQVSPLHLLDFAILNCNYSFISPKDQSDVQPNFPEYEIDLDYAIIDEQDIIRVFIKASINQGESQMPGHALFVEGVAVFELSKSLELSEADKSSLMQYSTVSIALNSLRAFVASFTASAPFGKYLIPTIDVNDLFEQKSKLQNKQKSKKRKAKA